MDISSQELKLAKVYDLERTSDLQSSPMIHKNHHQQMNFNKTIVLDDKMYPDPLQLCNLNVQ